MKKILSFEFGVFGR